MKKIRVVGFRLGLAILCFSPFVANPCDAQTYPTQPIQLVITLAPGDTLDLTGRAIGAELAKVLKTSVVPVNKTGGAGTVGADFVAKGRKDGYTFYTSTQTSSIPMRTIRRMFPTTPFRIWNPWP